MLFLFTAAARDRSTGCRPCRDRPGGQLVLLALPYMFVSACLSLSLSGAVYIRSNYQQTSGRGLHRFHFDQTFFNVFKGRLCCVVSPFRPLCASKLPKVMKDFVNGVKSLDIPDIDIRARYYFIRLISGCLTPPSLCPVRPSAAEFLISGKTMVCLCSSTK